MLIRTSFAERVQSMKVRTFCVGCGKKLTRTVSQSYFDNGLHDARATAAENWKKVRAEAAAITNDGVTCKGCEGAASDAPIVNKVRDGVYKARDRKTSRVLGTIYRVTNRGWIKWRTNKDRRHSGHRSLSDAVESLGRIAKQESPHA